MAQENATFSFIGQKISKICWCARNHSSTNTNHFVTGSYDDKTNFLTYWNIPDEGVGSEPEMMNNLQVDGSVTDMVFMSPSMLLCSSSLGDVSLVAVRDLGLNEVQKWSKLHQYEATREPSVCCCIATSNNEIITGGEDGRINLLLVDRKKPVRVLENADSSNITGIQFLTTNEIVSVNTTGQLKLWDIRQPEIDKPQKVLTLSGNACPLLSVDKHPNQPHILVTGHGDGVIGIWDVRQEKAPVTLIDAHQAEVWQVKFHPLYPDNLFTCSQDGSCWFWDGTSMISGANDIKAMNLASGRVNATLQTNDIASSSVWLYIDANKHKMETFSLLPDSKCSVNTFDVNGSSLICGTDNEAIVIVKDIPVR